MTTHNGGEVMTTVKVSSLCSGHGRCYALHPDVYDSDEETGYTVHRDGEFQIPSELTESAIGGAKACPERAITVEEGT